MYPVTRRADGERGRSQTPFTCPVTEFCRLSGSIQISLSKLPISTDNLTQYHYTRFELVCLPYMPNNNHKFFQKIKPVFSV